MIGLSPLFLCFLIPLVFGQLDDTAEVRGLLDLIQLETTKKLGLFNAELTPKELEKAREKFKSMKINDGTEASVNRPVVESLFENDIVLTVPQAKMILKEVKNSPKPDMNRKRKPRQAQPTLSSFWKELTISYRFQLNDTRWREKIRSGLRHIESETCIRFEEDGQESDFLEFIRAGGCWSNVGRLGGKQQVSIGYGCESLGIVAHETLHALGLWHEQSRTDRDNYILIDYQNIYRSTEYNFAKRTPSTSDNQGQPYDLGSVMHYGSRAFTTSWDKYTIETKDPKYQQTIGQRERISFKDAKMINLRYCKNICPKELDCLVGGYVDPNRCDRCKCPEGYDGRYCERLAESNLAACEGIDVNAVNGWRWIKSPGIQSGMSCFWRIKAKQGFKIALYVSGSNFPCKDACSSYLEVKYAEDKTKTGARFCCDRPKDLWISEDNEVVVMLKTDRDLTQGWLGFQIYYKLYGPGTTTELPITSARELSTTTAPEVTETEPTEEPYTEETEETHETEATTEVTITSTTPSTTTERPTTSLATTRRSTSPEPTTTTEEIWTTQGAHWSSWAAWSQCTVACGGCGTRKRVRACYGGDYKCPGLPYELEDCGLEPCPVPTRGNRCKGQLIMPCDLMAELDFGTTTKVRTSALFQNAKNRDTLPELLFTKKNGAILKKAHQENFRRHKRYVDGDAMVESGDYCAKVFTYLCPTNFLVINIERKQQKDTKKDILPGDPRLCCKGYYPEDGKCLKLQVFGENLH